jgi:hypothetical protein
MGRVVLLQSYRAVTCLAPATGALRATARYAAAEEPDWIAVATTGDTLLAVQGAGLNPEVFAVRLPGSLLRLSRRGLLAPHDPLRGAS